MVLAEEDNRSAAQILRCHQTANRGSCRGRYHTESPTRWQVTAKRYVPGLRSRHRFHPHGGRAAFVLLRRALCWRVDG